MNIPVPTAWRAWVLAAFAALGVSACSSSRLAVPSREPPAASSLEALAGALAEDMLDSPLLRMELAAKFPDSVPTVEIPPGAICNSTARMLDTATVLEKPLLDQLAASGAFRVVDTAALQKAVKEGRTGADDRFPKIERLPVTDFMLYGNFSEMRDPASAMGFRLVLKLLDKHSGRIVWMGQKDTVSRQSIVSWKGAAKSQLDLLAVPLADGMLSNPLLNRKVAMKFPNRIPDIEIPAWALKNETSQADLNENIALDSIRTALVNSGVFGVLDLETMATRNAMEESWALPLLAPGNGPVPQPVADYVLFGTISETRDGALVHLRMQLQLLEKRSGSRDWTDESELVFQKSANSLKSR
jgi:hypothetical protein